MSPIRALLLLPLVAVWFFVASLPLAAQAPAVQKRAFVCGVEKYLKDGLTDLHYCVRDMQELAKALRGQGFTVTELHGDRATRAELGRQLAAFIAGLQQLNKRDLAVIAFSGHGRQMRVEKKDEMVVVEDAFFCPCDAVVNNATTLLSLSQVMQQLDEHSGSSQNLLLIDACRDNPSKGGKGIDGSTVRALPNKISVLFSSSPGKQSFYSHKVRHGVFTHVLLEGLAGKAADADGEVTWLGLSSYVMKEVPRQAPQLLESDDEQQPNLIGNLVSQPVLARLERATPTPRPAAPPLAMAPFNATQARQHQTAWATHLNVPLTVTNTIGMKLNLIPPGEFLMGSPADEKDRSDNETQHRVRLTKPFYLGMYEVTQAEYEQVMGTNPSYFSTSGNGKDRVTGQDTRRFPVESISHDEAVEFCRRLSAKEGKTYRLPTEAEWVYACRAGTTTLFHFGGVCNGREANVNGNYPYGTTTEGPNLERPTTVGSYAANPFGLYDLHGNVWEWCQDWWGAKYYDDLAGRTTDDPLGDNGEKLSRVLCGGSYSNIAESARAKRGAGRIPESRVSNLGFRAVRTP